ncbi:MAG: hypothetical protein HKO56_04655 [Bacteroidia bacterium]|nr:hypothetical protein [Bacteroidia bacterium]NNC85301.1 hypothetical protein [Bacteroidia bacterium]NNM15928.1 hypothetical protein [Bacteroidia bacterium]
MKFNYIFLLLGLFVLGSCSSTYNEFTDLELAEYQIYTQNQQLIFANASGQTERYQISGVFGGYNESGDTYNELVRDNIIKLNDSSAYNKGYYQILKDGDAVLTSFLWPHHALEKSVTNSPKIPLYVFNGDTLLNVTLSVTPPLLIDSANTYVDSVYFHQSLGIFKYTDIYNNTWTKTN